MHYPRFFEPFAQRTPCFSELTTNVRLTSASIDQHSATPLFAEYRSVLLSDQSCNPLETNQ